MFNILKLTKKYIKNISITILLILTITIICIILKKQIIKKNNTLLYSLPNNYDIYTHQGNEVIIDIYRTTIKKNIKFKITAQHIRYLSGKKNIQFIQPKIIIFDIKNQEIWKITSNQAILNYEKKILNLHEYVHINNLSNNTHHLSMMTNHININLITNDILSNTIVIVHGYYFYSVGTKMRGNLYTQIIQLFKNTKTFYEIQHTQHTTNNIYSR